MAYIFNQIRRIQEHTEYLNEIIKELANMPPGDSSDSGCPGNIFYISVYNDVKTTL